MSSRGCRTRGSGTSLIITHTLSTQHRILWGTQQSFSQFGLRTSQHCRLFNSSKTPSFKQSLSLLLISSHSFQGLVLTSAPGFPVQAGVAGGAWDPTVKQSLEFIANCFPATDII
jgi:hypothetical protein